MLQSLCSCLGEPIATKDKDLKTYESRLHGRFAAAIANLKSVTNEVEACLLEAESYLDVLAKQEGYSDSDRINSARRELAKYQNSAQQPVSTQQTAILGAILALREAGALKKHVMLVASLSGVSPESDAFINDVKQLQGSRLIDIAEDSVELTPTGLALTPMPADKLTSGILTEKVAQQLPRLPRLALQTILSSGAAGASRDNIISACGRTRVDGPILSAVSLLQRLSLIEKAANNRFVCGDILLLE